MATGNIFQKEKTTAFLATSESNASLFLDHNEETKNFYKNKSLELSSHALTTGEAPGIAKSISILARHSDSVALLLHR
jgi:hypothetical protein